MLSLIYKYGCVHTLTSLLLPSTCKEYVDVRVPPDDGLKVFNITFVSMKT